MTHRPNSLVEILRWRSINQPDRLAYRFLVDGENEEVVMTYQELDRKARSIAALLQSSAKEGDRAILLFPPGLDFVAAYFGCLYAKVIAIPAYPPHPARPEKTIPIIQRVAADAKPSMVLLTTALFDALRLQNIVVDEQFTMKWLVTEGDAGDHADKWQQPNIEKNDIAFLQYTSGSTTTPKGVVVTHGNLIHNLQFIEASFGLSGDSHTVFWLPPYHDMGLIGGILQAMYTGFPVTLIPHLMFLQRPIRWLQAISRYRATCSGGPNFAYDLCTRKVKPEQLEQLDLSSWEVAFNGAEPVYHKTLNQFADCFAPCGFRAESFLPCYGLAEATLMVVGGPKSRLPVIQHLVSTELELNKVIISDEENENTRTLVSCGQNTPGQQIRIVDTETLLPCCENVVGEIWVSGPSVAGGYWNKLVETEFTFNARLSDNGEPFLRTGDLGFLYNNELYITGRLKNLIITEGKNHYAHDIERTVEIAHPSIRPAGCAVFSIYRSGRENIIVIAELEQRNGVNAEDVVNAIRKAVSIHHELYLEDIRLIRPGGIPRTTSGKIKHFVCKTNYMAGALE